MDVEYKVMPFLPTIKGCFAQDMGWDAERCKQFQTFLNKVHAEGGWKLHSSEMRQAKGDGCSNPIFGSALICVFERPKAK